MTVAATLDTETIAASLRLIMPPTALIDIGIGRGIGAMHQWSNWDVPAAWLVDAESAPLAWAETLAATHPGWRVHAATLADIDGQAPFFRSSNPAENGLLPAAKLAALWPNLRQEEQAERPTLRLDTLLAGDGELPQGAGWWLIVDCLPALRILQGAAATLERCSVLWVRALLQPLPQHEAGTTVEDLQAFLAPLGFRCVQVTEGNHPALGDALFVRDWALRLQPLIGELRENNAQAARQHQELDQRLAAQEAAMQAGAQERDAHAKLAAERQAKLDAASKDNAELAARLATAESAGKELADRGKALQEQLDQLNIAREEQAKLACEHAVKLAKLNEEHEILRKEFESLSAEHNTAGKAREKLSSEHEKLRAEHDKMRMEHDKLGKEHATFRAEHENIGKEREKLSKEHQSIKSEVQAKDVAIASLNERIGEQDQRERQLVEEIVRAEAQIELIKDLLLREGGL